MHWWHREPTLKDMLSDSIVRAVMEADGVDPQELEGDHAASRDVAVSQIPQAKAGMVASMVLNS